MNTHAHEHPDVYGQALLDFVRDNHPEDIVVHCDISEVEVYPLDHFFRNYDGFPEPEKRAVRACRGKVLDVGAGAGVHSRYLQEVGFEAYPIDVSEGAVQAMRLLDIQNVRKLDFFAMSREKYDTLLLLMNGFGIMGTLDRVPEFFKKCTELLSPGGQILFDSSDLLYLYQEEDGSIRHDLNKAYYGEVVYQMEYKGKRGVAFPWLFIDYATALEHATPFGFTGELLWQGTTNQYLARLTLED